jgi:hypothetical protein
VTRYPGNRSPNLAALERSLHQPGKPVDDARYSPHRAPERVEMAQPARSPGETAPPGGAVTRVNPLGLYAGGLLASGAHVSSSEGTCSLCGGGYSYGARVALVEGHGDCHLVPCCVELAGGGPL